MADSKFIKNSFETPSWILFKKSSSFVCFEFLKPREKKASF